MSARGFVAGSIAEMLAAVAEGIREAQEALSDVPPLDEFGRPQPTYFLPHVDFELKVDVETRSGGGIGSPVLLIAPITSTERTTTSTVSGRFVAIPPGEGRPAPVLFLTAARLSARRHQLTVTAANTAGEFLDGAAVELNLDPDSSRALSAAADISLSGLRSSNFEAAVIETDARGEASTVLTIDSGLPARAQIVVTAEFGTARTRIVLPAGAE